MSVSIVVLATGVVAASLVNAKADREGAEEVGTVAMSRLYPASSAARADLPATTQALGEIFPAQRIPAVAAPEIIATRGRIVPTQLNDDSPRPETA